MTLADTAAEAVREWTALFNAQDYFAAHEVLEHPWLGAKEPDRTFLKGLIHAAVALYHYSRGNGHGARVKYASCRRYLEPYRPAYGEVDLDALLDELERFYADLLALPPRTPPPSPRHPWPQAALVSGEC